MIFFLAFFNVISRDSRPKCRIFIFQKSHDPLLTFTYPGLEGSPEPAASLAVGRHERADGGRPAVRVLLELDVGDDDVGLEDGPAVGADGVGPARGDVDVRRAAVLAFLGGGHGAVNRRLTPESLWEDVLFL